MLLLSSGCYVREVHLGPSLCRYHAAVVVEIPITGTALSRRLEVLTMTAMPALLDQLLTNGDDTLDSSMSPTYRPQEVCLLIQVSSCRAFKQRAAVFHHGNPKNMLFCI